MECQECQQRPATLHFKKFINGTKSEVHLCDVCAKEKGYMSYPEEGYSLHNLLTGLFNFDSNQIDSQQSSFHKTQKIQCPQCGLSLSDFKHSGKFGCAGCYKTFAIHLDPILQRVHSGNTKHNGKIPKRQGGNLHKKKELEMLKIQLQQLITSEEFEEAAVVRDKIKDLERKINNTEAGGK